MARRHVAPRPRWVLFLLALAAAACRGTAAAPTPVPTPAGPPPGWSGSARFVDSAISPTFPGSSTRTWDCNLTWQREANPDPALPAGSVRYEVTASQMRLSYHMDASYAGPGWEGCTFEGETSFVLQPFHTDDPADDLDWRTFITVAADGNYRGAIHSQGTVPYTVTCPGGTLHRTLDSDIHLYIQGQLMEGGRRMKGEMAPDKTTFEIVTGSWDFSAH